MDKIALITDSTSDLNEELISKYDIKMLNLKIIYKDREYVDRVDITPQQVYDNLKVEVPHTSLPSIQDMHNLFNRLQSEGYTHAIAICISSGLSGTYNTLKLAASEHTNLNITVFDSKSLTLGAGALVLGCGEMLKNGKTYDEIVQALPAMRDKVSVYYMVDTLEYLIKGGRIGKVSGALGQLLNLKPIISINADGVYYTHTKVRGKKQAKTKLMEIVQDTLSATKAKIWVMHGGSYDEGQKFYEDLKDNPNITHLGFGDISPVAGVHTGPGLIGVVIAKEPFV
ncbi:DegV family EDD domain-containing protein [Clostridium bovifaecis]|uniref:DegV family EDD domain-containing protein n=1 Tax=Clostridium bovifaecis TaxID=2184719 RepID=A0A6I6ER19_9CLOT|nr:DegV family EDD domain-containing protein [Clostridium bovifaecis]